MKLLTELLENTVSLIEEGKENEKRQFISGIFLQAGIPNRNHRIYPVETLKNEVTRYSNEKIAKNRAYGEMNHPAGPNINGDRIAIHIKELKQNENNFIGKALIASTPMGDIVKGLLKDGASLGVSSRALGSLKPVKEAEGISEVQDDLQLLAVDVVTDPSAPSAYVNGIFENKEWVFNHGVIVEKYVEKQQKVLKKSSIRQIEEQKLQMFNRFIHKISQL